MQISFYHLTKSTLNEALPKLAEVILAKNERIIVFSQKAETLGLVDVAFWSVGGTRFLPHCTENEDNKELQPIYLTSKQENPNGAKILIILDGEMPEFANKFERVLDVFNGNDDAELANARKRWAENKAANIPQTYYFQDEKGAWQLKN